MNRIQYCILSLLFLLPLISGCQKQKRELRVVEKAKEKVDLHDGLAHAESEISLGRYPEAISILERLKREWPDNPDLYYLLGKAYEALGEDRMSVEAYMRALELDPSIPKRKRD